MWISTVEFNGRWRNRCNQLIYVSFFLFWQLPVNCPFFPNQRERQALLNCAKVRSSYNRSDCQVTESPTLALFQGLHPRGSVCRVFSYLSLSLSHSQSRLSYCWRRLLYAGPYLCSSISDHFTTLFMYLNFVKIFDKLC
jgi:hypothetical protein